MNSFKDRISSPNRLLNLAETAIFACLVFGGFSFAPIASAAVAARAQSSEPVSAEAGKKVSLSPEAERQAVLADDTAKLLILANELKTELDKSSKDTLSLSVVKKAEEVERLARKVREEMKKSIGN